MVQEWVWGDTPTGFKRVSSGQIQMMMVRESLEPYLTPEKFIEQRESGKEASYFHGRDRLRFLHLDNGDTALVRAYRHGGVLRRLTGDFFFTWPPRPFRELVLTEEVRRRGVPTVEIFAACVERIWGPFYRGWLITRELRGADDLWAALQSDLYVGTAGRSLLQAVAQSLRKLHRQGVYHGDLNLRNILVRREAEEIRSYIIDFDKAKLFPREVSPERARRNMSRLLRSVCKLDPQRRHLSEKDWELFIRFYQEVREE
jgi:tRNA A-37 threonylcarbamoyl transferase component Bud32